MVFVKLAHGRICQKISTLTPDIFFHSFFEQHSLVSIFG